MNANYYVYILASGLNSTLYVGVTNDLIKRVWQHKEESVKGFTQRYKVNQLVYFEQYADTKDAITREKRIKKWERVWKVRLIEEKNPRWEDLYPSLIQR